MAKSPKKHDKPAKADKGKITAKLLAKGVSLGVAKHLSGEGEDLTAQEIAARRVAWQRTLGKKK